MEDAKIVDLYWERSESAISESNKKYGKYCRYIANNILNSKEDSEECVNDTWISAWNSMPNQRPSKLQAFLGKITRNLALNRFDYNTAKKRRHLTTEVIDEYWECIPNHDMPIDDEISLKQAINSFLASLDKRTRIIFMRRYWYSLSVNEIANGMDLSENHVAVILHRTRKQFKEHLEKEGVYV